MDSERWVYRYDGPDSLNDIAYSLVYGADGNIYAAGVSRAVGSGYDFTVASLTTTPVGVAEPVPREKSGCPVPPVVRGVLRLGAASGLKHQATSCLLDISGREVMRLQSGANDVSRLAPGIYFVHEQLKPEHQAQAVRKVILMR
jgi:hypothetical protein